MTAIAGIAVNLTANIGGFMSGTLSAAQSLGGVRAAFDRATDAGAAYQRMTDSVGQFKLAGQETVQSVQTALAVARGELRKFARNKDVMVAVEFGREQIDEAWIKARSTFQRLAERTKLNVAAGIVSERSQSARAWLDRQRRQLTKPLTVRVELARRAVDGQLAAVRKRLDSLKAYRSVRITLAAVNATKMPVQAALATLGPIRRMATRGLVVGLRATHFGIASGVKQGRALLGGLAGFGKSVVGGLTSGFALVGAGLTALGAYTFGSLVNSGMETITTTKRVADRIGSSTLELSRMQYAAQATGASVDRMQEGLNEMVQRLGEAKTGTGSAADGLKMIGLSADELTQKSPAEAFKQISDAINKLPNQSDRVFAIDEIFGGDGRELINLIQQGSAGIDKLGAEADKLGASFNDVDAQQVLEASRAVDRLKTVVVGVGNTLAIQLAPFVELVANKLTGLATTGDGVGAKIITAFEWVTTAIAYVADYLSLGVATFKMFQAAATISIAGVVKAIDYLGQGVVWLLNKLGMETEWNSFTGDLAKGLTDEAKDLFIEAGENFDDFMRGKNQKAVGQWFDDVRANSKKAAEQVVDDQKKMTTAIGGVSAQAEQIKKLNEALKGIQQDVSTFGLGETDRELAKLKELGATDAQLADARGLLTIKEQLDGLSNIDTGDALTDYAAKMETLTKLWGDQKISLKQFETLRDNAQKTLGDKLADQAKSVVESVKSPLDKYNEELAKLQTLLDRGLITQQVFDAAQAKAKATLDAANADSRVELAAPKALRSGTAEAQRLAYDAARGVQRTMNKDEVAKKQLNTQEAMQRHLADIARNTRGGAAVEIEEVTL